MVIVTVTEFDDVPPAAPSSVEAVAVNETAAQLRWKEPRTSTSYGDDDDEYDYEHGGSAVVTGYTVVYSEVGQTNDTGTRLSLNGPSASFVTRYSRLFRSVSVTVFKSRLSRTGIFSQLSTAAQLIRAKVCIA